MNHYSVDPETIRMENWLFGLGVILTLVSIIILVTNYFESDNTTIALLVGGVGIGLMVSSAIWDSLH